MVIVVSACQHASQKPEPAVQASSLAVISINDVYRTAGIDAGKTGGLARVRALRKKLQSEYEHVLLLHAGDFLHPSFASKQDNGASMIQIMNHLDGAFDEFDQDMVVTFGNHEFDKSKAKYTPLMEGLLNKSEFTWLDSNINWQTGFNKNDHVINSIIKTYGDLNVGIFSFTTDMQHPDFIESFDGFAATAEKYVPALREQGADVVIALTHQWLQDDVAMMQLPLSYRPDVIFGGHEHFAQLEAVNDRWIIKADADAASAAVVEISQSNGGVSIEQPIIVPLDHNIQEDPKTARWVAALNQSIDHAYCRKIEHESEQCLATELGKTQVKLIAEETEIRRFETNLGSLLADLALAPFKSCGADIALLNSGSIRLNQNIPAGDSITQKHLEEMFPYPSDLRLIEINGKTLQAILNHSVSGWTANGHWLQIAGLAYTHDSDLQTATHIHVNSSNETIQDDQIFRAVVPHYLISPVTNHDGYHMIDESMEVSCEKTTNNPTLRETKHLFKQYLMQSPEGISPETKGRICHVQTQQCN